MNRLREFDLVVVTLPDDASLRDASFKCHVVAMAESTVALEPIERAAVTWLPDTVHGAFLVFRHDGALIALKGTLFQPGRVGDLRFKVSDGVAQDRRDASRTNACLPIALRRAGSRSESQGLTVDLGADGIVVDATLDVVPGDEVETTLSLPGADEPVESVATVIRAEGGRVALRFGPADRTSRARLARFVLERNRAALRRWLAPQNEPDF